VIIQAEKVNPILARFSLSLPSTSALARPTAA
jgi:hypothetical protein